MLAALWPRGQWDGGPPESEIDRDFGAPGEACSGWLDLGWESLGRGAFGVKEIVQWPVWCRCLLRGRRVWAERGLFLSLSSLKVPLTLSRMSADADGF